MKNAIETLNKMSNKMREGKLPSKVTYTNFKDEDISFQIGEQLPDGRFVTSIEYAKGFFYVTINGVTASTIHEDNVTLKVVFIPKEEAKAIMKLTRHKMDAI